MSGAKTIGTAIITTSAAVAICGAIGQPALASAGLGLAFSLANELLFMAGMRSLSPRRLTFWPKMATSLLFMLAWLGKQAILLAGLYFVFKATTLPVLPFGFTILGYQVIHVALMILQPNRYARYVLAERTPHITR